MLAALRRRLPSSIDAEDVYQQGALRAVSRASALRDPARAEAWLARVMRHAAVDAIRRAQATAPLDQEPPAPEAAAEICGCSMARLRELPTSYRRVLERVALAGTSLDELARERAITRGNAAVLVHRARRALQQRLRDHCGAESLRECLSCVCVARGCCD